MTSQLSQPWVKGTGCKQLKGARNSEATQKTASATRKDVITSSTPTPNSTTTPTTPLAPPQLSSFREQQKTAITPGPKLTLPRSDRDRVTESGDRDVTSWKGENSVRDVCSEDSARKGSPERKEVKEEEVNYNVIDDLDELRRLLSGTADFEEKRKIRSAMRRLRRNVEIEKPQTLTTAGTGETSSKDKDARAALTTGQRGSQITDTPSSLLDTAGERPQSTDKGSDKPRPSTALARPGDRKPLENGNQVKVGSSESLSRLGKARPSSGYGFQTPPQDQDPAAIAYTPFERRPSLRAGQDRDLTVLVRDKVRMALRCKLHTVTPISAWTDTTTTTTTDASVSLRADSQADEEHQLTALVSEKVQQALRDRLQTSASSHALSLSQDTVRAGIRASEAERKRQDEQLTALVKEKVQEVLNSKFHTLQGKPEQGTAEKRQPSEPSFTKRPQGISGYKSWEDSLRNSKSSTVSSDRSFRTENRRRSSIDRKPDLQNLTQRDDSDGKSGSKDRSGQCEDVDGPESSRQTVRKERSQLRRPSSPFSSQSLHTAADSKPDSVTAARRPSNPRLRRPSSPSLIGVQHVQRPASPSLTRRRASSPFLSEGHLLDKAQSGPLQSPLSPLSRRPASPLLSEGNRRSSLTFQSLSSINRDEPVDLLSENKPIIKEQARASDRSDRPRRLSKGWEDELNWDLLHKVKARLQARRSSLRSSEDQGAASSEPPTLRDETAEAKDQKDQTKDQDQTKVQTQDQSKDQKDQTNDQKDQENRRLSQTGASEAKSDDQAGAKETSTASRPTNETTPEIKESGKLSSDTSVNENDTHTPETPPPPETKTWSAKPLTVFDKLDKGLKPSVSKSLVSSLADKFSSTDTASSPLKVFAVSPNESESSLAPEKTSSQDGSLKKRQSLRVSQQAERAEGGRGNRVPARAESLNTHDVERKFSGLKKEATFAGDSRKDAGKSERELEPRTSEKLLTKSDLTQSSDLKTDGKVAGVKDREPSSGRGSVQAKEATTSSQQLSGQSRAVKMTKDDPAATLLSAPHGDKSQGQAEGSGSGSGSCSMENAFSALLDDMGAISASEDTASDLDLSDGDETLAERSKSVTKDQRLSPKTTPENLTSKGGNISRSADVTVSESGGSSAAVKRSNSLTRRNNAVAGLTPVAEDAEHKHTDKGDGKVLDKRRRPEKDDDDVFDEADGADMKGVKLGVQPLTQSEVPSLTIVTRDDLQDPTPSSSKTTHDEDQHTATSTEVAKRDKTSRSATKALGKETFNSIETPEIRTPDNIKSWKETSAKRNSGKSLAVVKDDDGGVIYRKISRDEKENRVYTIRSKLRRTSSDASEELRDTILETNFLAPGGAAVQERDVIRSRRKITPGGSNYHVRTTQRTTRVRDVSGSDFVEQDMTVECDNTSVREGRSWGSKTVTKVTLDTEDTDPGDLPLDELCSLPQLAELGGRRSGNTSSTCSTIPVKMDMSKASSGYGSVSGSEEEDKDLLSPTTTAAACLDLRPSRMVGVPEVLSTLKDVTSVEGQTVLLECTLMGHPTPDVTWFFDDDRMDLSDDRVTAHFDAASGKATLTFLRVSMGDRGLYTCTCSNQFGEATTKAALLVKQRPSNKPFFEEPLRDVTVVEDHSVTLQCVVTSALSVAGYKDGIVQRNSSDFRQTFYGRVARLEIGEVFSDDVGQYTCLARNEVVGEERSTCTLRVSATGGSDSEMVPTFLTKLHNKTLRVGEDLLLAVEVIGSPLPEIAWRRDGVDLPDTLTTATRYDGRVAQLRMEKMAVEEEGVFECLALNAAGQACMDARVTVHKRSKRPTITAPLQDVTSPPGSSVTLRCSVSGTPTPSVFWRRNGLIVADTPDFQQSLESGEARLSVAALREKHGGQYECVAKNEAGDAVCSCLLSVIAPTPQGDVSPVPKGTPSGGVSADSKDVSSQAPAHTDSLDILPAKDGVASEAGFTDAGTVRDDGTKIPEQIASRKQDKRVTDRDQDTQVSSKVPDKEIASRDQDKFDIIRYQDKQTTSRDQDKQTTIRDQDKQTTSRDQDKQTTSRDQDKQTSRDQDTFDIISDQDKQTTIRDQGKQTTIRDQDKQTTSRDQDKQTTSRDQDKQTTIMDQDKQTTSRDQDKQTTSRDQDKQTTSRDQDKQTTIRDQDKQTTIRDQDKQTTIRDQDKQTTIRDQDKQTSRDQDKQTTSRDQDKQTTSMDQDKQTTSRDQDKQTTSRDQDKQTTSRDQDKQTTSRDQDKQTTSRDQDKQTTSRDQDKQTTIRDQDKQTTSMDQDKQTTSRDQDKQTTSRDQDKQTTSRDQDKQTSRDKQTVNRDRQTASRDKQTISEQTHSENQPRQASADTDQKIPGRTGTERDTAVSSSGASTGLEESSPLSLPRGTCSSSRAARARPADVGQRSSEDQTDSAALRKLSMLEKTDLPRSQSANQLNAPRRKISEPPVLTSKRQTFGSPRSTVSELRAQFSKLEEQGSSEKTDTRGGRGAVRRSSSTPPREERPAIVKNHEIHVPSFPAC
ncbi:hypothetical protein ACOMHN_035603 [Nucella lapillus]